MTIHINENGHLSDEGTALYVDALKLDRTDQLPEPIRAHVAECQECRANVTGLFALLAEDPLMGSHPTLDRQARRWSPPPAAYRIAAVILAAIGIAAVAYYTMRPERTLQPSPQVATVQRAPEPARAPEVTQSGRAESKDLAANFTPYEELEGFIGSEVRGESFEVTSPGERVTDHRAIAFSWKSAGSGPWKIVVVDNHGSIVKEAEPESTRCVLDGPFKPGLYYWKVLRNEELAHVGKFRVE